MQGIHLTGRYTTQWDCNAEWFVMGFSRHVAISTIGPLPVDCMFSAYYFLSSATLVPIWQGEGQMEGSIPWDQASMSQMISPSQLWCDRNIVFILKWFVMKWSLQIFAHATTAALSWHVKKFVVILLPGIGLWEDGIMIKLVLCVEKHECNGRLCQFRGLSEAHGCFTFIRLDGREH